jgi:hypothetical protein
MIGAVCLLYPTATVAVSSSGVSISPTYIGSIYIGTDGIWVGGAKTFGNE